MGVAQIKVITYQLNFESLFGDSSGETDSQNDVEDTGGTFVNKKSVESVTVYLWFFGSN